MKQTDEAKVLAHLRGEMNDQERRQFEKRLAMDPHLAKEHAKSERLLGLIRRWEPGGSPVDLTAAVMAQVVREPLHNALPFKKALPQKRRIFPDFRSFFLPGIAALATAAALVIALRIFPEALVSLPAGVLKKIPFQLSGDRHPMPTILIEVQTLDGVELEAQRRVLSLGATELRVTVRSRTVVLEGKVPTNADFAGAFRDFGKLVRLNSGYVDKRGRTVIVIRLASGAPPPNQH